MLRRRFLGLALGAGLAAVLGSRLSPGEPWALADPVVDWSSSFVCKLPEGVMLLQPGYRVRCYLPEERRGWRRWWPRPKPQLRKIVAIDHKARMVTYG